MTREDFLREYEAQLVAHYPWAQDNTRRARFMSAVVATIEGPGSPWNFHGAATTAAWQAIGGKGTPTRKALRALPTASLAA